MKKFFLCTIALLFSPIASAIESCPTPEEISAAPIDFDDLFSEDSLQEIVKGEFETTVQFEARLADRPHPPKKRHSN